MSKSLARINSSDLALAAQTRKANIFVCAMGLLLIDGIGLDLLIKFTWIGTIATMIGMVIVGIPMVQASLRVGEIRDIRSRKPVAYPPQRLQCCICGCDAADETEYDGFMWTDFFGFRVHYACKDWVWPEWHPRR